MSKYSSSPVNVYITAEDMLEYKDAKPNQRIINKIKEANMDPLELLLKLSTYLDGHHRPVYNETDKTIRELAEDLKNFVENVRYEEEQKLKLEEIRRIEDGEQE